MGYRGLSVNKTNAPQKNTLEKKKHIGQDFANY